MKCKVLFFGSYCLHHTRRKQFNFFPAMHNTLLYFFRNLQYLIEVYFNVFSMESNCEMYLKKKFYSSFYLYGYLPYTYPPPFSPFLRLPFLIPCHFLPYGQSYPPQECDGSYSLLRCIAIARGHSETAKNLCRYSLAFNIVCSQSNSL